jgi:hypothetical protein
MTVTTMEPARCAEGWESGRRSFEAFLLDGERLLVDGRGDSGTFETFLRALPSDLRAAIAAHFEGRASLREQHRWEALPDIDSSDDPICEKDGPADSVIHESKATTPGRIGSIDLLLEELTIDPIPVRRSPRFHDAVFLDVTTLDDEGGVSTTGNRICPLKQCAPAAFYDRVLATIRIDQSDNAWPRTVSFEVDAVEATDDRLPEMIGAACEYLQHDLIDGCDDSHVRSWLDCFTLWFEELLPRDPDKRGEVVLGGVQFNATLTDPQLDYVYRNRSTGRRIEIVGSSLVRSRPMVHTFAGTGERLQARFRLGLRGAGSLGDPPIEHTSTRVLETAEMEGRR